MHVTLLGNPCRWLSFLLAALSPSPSPSPATYPQGLGSLMSPEASRPMAVLDDNIGEPWYGSVLTPFFPCISELSQILNESSPNQCDVALLAGGEQQCWPVGEKSSVLLLLAGYFSSAFPNPLPCVFRHFFFIRPCRRQIKSKPSQAKPNQRNPLQFTPNPHFALPLMNAQRTARMVPGISGVPEELRNLGVGPSLYSVLLRSPGLSEALVEAAGKLGLSTLLGK